MSQWYQKIIADPNDTNLVDSAVKYFETEFVEAVKEVDLPTLRGQRVEEVLKKLPGMYGYRWAQLQELEAILGFLEIRKTAIMGLRRRHYIEHYNRNLNATTAEKYVDADDEVLAVALLINRVAFTRNSYLSVTKRHESLQYRLRDVTNLIVAGVNDALL